MTTCAHCGTAADHANRFCAHCGAALAEAAPAADSALEPTRVIPPAATGAPSPVAVLPEIDWRGLLRGNWVGAGVTAGVILAVAGLCSLLLAFLAKPDNFGLGNSLTLVMSILASAFGADFVVHASVEGQTVRASLGVFPVLVSLVTAAAGIKTFRRITEGYPRGTTALADAGRVALLVAAPLFVGSLVFHSDTDKLGKGWAADVLDFMDAKASFGAWAASSLFLSFLSVFVVLAVASFLRRDWWAPQVQRVHDWVAAPMSGSLVILWLLPLAGLIGFVLLMFGDSNTEDLHSNDDWMASVALILGLLANGGMWLLAIGTGSSFGTSGSFDGSHESDMSRLATITDTEPGLWAAPLVVVLLLFWAARVVARRSQPGQILRNLALWVASLLVTVPLLLRLTTVHFSYSAGGFADSRGHGFAGPNGFETVVFIAGIALVCALVVAKLANALDLSEMKRQLERLGQFQTTPAQVPVPVPVEDQDDSRFS